MTAKDGGGRMRAVFRGGAKMGDKKSPFGYLIEGLLGAAATAVSVVGLSRLMPRMMANCKGMMEKCCGGPEAGKTSGKKRKK